MLDEMMAERKLLRKRWIWIVVLLLYVGFIFHNSLTPADESSRQSGRVLQMILRSIQWIGMEGGWITEYLVRKTAHFAEYTLLGILLIITLRQYFEVLTVRRILQCWLGSLIPLVDETLQLFTEGRSGQISDVWLDMAGTFTGFLFAGAVYWLLTKRERKGGNGDGKKYRAVNRI